MPGVNETPELTTSGKSPDLTVDSFNGYVPADLDANQLAMYQQASRPAMQALNPNDYYPDLNHQIGVGNYSGSEIGSTTLFAPGGGLVPIGMMDARDANIQRAALQKAKELDEFKKQFQAPTTKHVAVQGDLTKSYVEGNEKWWANAMKKSGGDATLAARILQNDQNFQAWNKSKQDLAKFHDGIVEHAAELQAAEKDPNFVLSPETRKSYTDLLSGAAYAGENPFDKRGHQIGLEFIGSRALYDLDKSTNDAIDKAIPDIEQLPVTYQQRGINEQATELEKEYFKPERIKEMAHTVYMQKYYGTSVTEDQVEKAIQAKLGEKIKRKLSTHRNTLSPSEQRIADEDRYSNNDFSDEPSSINTKIIEKKKPGEKNATLRDGEIEGSDGLTFKVPVKAVMPVGKTVYFTDEGLAPSKTIGNKNVVLGKIVLVDVIDNPGQWNDGIPVSVDQKEKTKTRKESMTLGKYEDKNNSGKSIEKPFLVPTKHVENSLVKQWGENKTVKKGVPVDEHYRRADEYNKKSVPAKKAETKPAATKKPEDLRKKYNY